VEDSETIFLDGGETVTYCRNFPTYPFPIQKLNSYEKTRKRKKTAEITTNAVQHPFSVRTARVTMLQCLRVKFRPKEQGGSCVGLREIRRDKSRLYFFTGGSPDNPLEGIDSFAPKSVD
jgi:hypothetical protein